MRKRKYTKGPWHTGLAGVFAPISSERNVMIAEVWNDENARLIAAAPDLLAALEADEAAFAMTIGDGRDHATRARRKLEATVKARQMMRAALAKARGEV